MLELIHLDRPVRFGNGAGRIREGMIQYLSRNKDDQWGLMVVPSGGRGALCWVSFDDVEQQDPDPPRPRAA